MRTVNAMLCVTAVLAACTGGHVDGGGGTSVGTSLTGGTTLLGFDGKCMKAVIGDEGPTNLDPVVLDDCDGSEGEQWTYANGQITGAGGLCLDANGGVAAAASSLLQLYACWGGPNQAWTMQPEGTITGIGGLCVDVVGANPADGTAIELWPCNGNANQIWQLGGAGAPTPPPAAPATGAADRILVVYNAGWPHDDDGDGTQDSLEVANYYALKRGIPPSHVFALALDVGDASGIDVSTYHTEIAQPLLAELAALGDTSIDTVLLAYGVPIGIMASGANLASVDNVLASPSWFEANAGLIGIFGYPKPYAAAAPGFEADYGAFDHARYALDGQQVYLVARLDGPRGPSGAMDLVDQALYAERYFSTQPGGFSGAAYVDSRGLGGSYTDATLATDTDIEWGDFGDYVGADENIAYTEHYFLGAGIPLFWENTTADLVIGQPGAMYSDGTTAAAAPRASFYGGWYNYGRYLDVFDWLPGSVADDLDSSSLTYWQIRDPNAMTYSWGTGALGHGASCVSGAALEPEVNGHPRPNVLLYYMLKGRSFAEASALATPFLGWMAVNIGDPLYAPFATAPSTARDDVAPVFAGGGAVATPLSSGTEMISALLDDSAAPEVGQLRVDYGASAAYGSSASSGNGYFRRASVTIGGLTSGAVYHYRVTAVDPVGNATTTADATFTAP